MAGRRPTPTTLKVLRGNPGKRPLNPKEPKPPTAIPIAPQHLTEIAKAEWDRIAPKLAQLGLLTDLDRAALAAYCCAYARWSEAEEALKKTGTVVRSPTNYP